jgi:hypothetical protein
MKRILSLLWLPLLLNACTTRQDGAAEGNGDTTVVKQDTSRVPVPIVKPNETDGKQATPDGGKQTPADGKSPKNNGGNNSGKNNGDAEANPRPMEDTSPYVPAADPFSLIVDSKVAFYTLPTFNNDIDDLNVKLEGLKPWAIEAPGYSGEYAAPLESDLREIRITPGGPGKVTLTFSYSAEVANDNGEIDYNEGEKIFGRLPVVGSTIGWQAAEPVFVSRGQFVSWEQAGRTYYGLIAHGRGKNNKDYILFRKTK